MTTVYFVRHGETENPARIVKSRTPGLHLTNKGREEAKDAAGKLAGKEISKIFSSPIERCFETAEILASIFNQPVIADPRLTEVLNAYQGMLMEEYHRLFLGKCRYKDPRQLQEGETAQVIVGRMQSFLGEILETFWNKTIIAVSHGDPIMLLEYSLIGKSPDRLLVSEIDRSSGTGGYIPLAGIFEFQFEGKKFLGESWSWA